MKNLSMKIMTAALCAVAILSMVMPAAAQQSATDFTFTNGVLTINQSTNSQTLLSADKAFKGVWLCLGSNDVGSAQLFLRRGGTNTYYAAVNNGLLTTLTNGVPSYFPASTIGLNGCVVQKPSWDTNIFRLLVTPERWRQFVR